MRVLLVEDDPLLGEGVNHTLRREGMSTEWLKEGANVAANSFLEKSLSVNVRCRISLALVAMMNCFTGRPIL